MARECSKWHFWKSAMAEPVPAMARPKADVDEKKEAEQPEWSWTYYLPLGILFCVLFCAGLSVFVGWTTFVDVLFTTVEESEHKSTQAIVINTVLVIMIVCCLPGPAFCIILDGFFFGFVKGFILGFIAETIGYIICICLARSCLKSRIRQWMLSSDVLHEVLLVFEEDSSGKFLVLFRFISLPVWIKNYAVGMLELQWLKTILIFLPAETFYCGIFSYIGSKSYVIADAIRKGDTQKAMSSFSGVEVVIVCVSVVGFLLIILFGWREYCVRRARIAEGTKGESDPLTSVAKPVV